MFQPVEPNVRFPELEVEIGRFWQAQRIYEKSLARRQGREKFVFYEGPPTANGLPHPGHCLTRAIKDLFPRYKTMRGFHCERKAGWDTHGLPVEVEVCKELGIHSKDQIEAYGVEPFIHRCQQSVWRYMRQWERLTQRIGFWIHLDEAYVTYHQSYVESVWWALKNLFDRGLLYQGHKIVWWWAQGGTALSAGEVGQGYRQVADPSVYVLFPLLDEQGNKTDTSLLAWTTTPWTLPSNQFLAVHPDLDYVQARDTETGQKIILAANLLETVAEKVKHELVAGRTWRGSELVGRRYLPPFPEVFYSNTLPGTDVTHGNLKRETVHGDYTHVGWRIVPGDFVSLESGTGVVHITPAFGEADYEIRQNERKQFINSSDPRLLLPVEPDGKFWDQRYAGVGSSNLDPKYKDWYSKYQRRWVKDCDKDLIRDLKERGLVYHQEQYLHDYPFCWRAEEDPLIQYPRKSWFIRTTQFKDRMLQNNRLIGWLPEHIRDGRFGNFLESNVDWALSRERYWGTPLPIWVCNKTGRMEAIGSYAELLEKPAVEGADAWQEARERYPDMPEDLKVHKPYIDGVTYASPFAKDGRMERVPEVIDCWFDSGAMPFAQWGYPHAKGSRERFESQFPADFISEAIDQTRGWFYSLLAISTMLFADEESLAEDARPHPLPHPYRNCIVLWLMLGEDGAKMSKSKRNYREPDEIFDRYGADALRWYFFANQPPWTAIRYSERAIKDSIPEFLLRLWNVYSFFVIYANIDGFDPAAAIFGDVAELTPDVLDKAKTYRPVKSRGELDRWILSELERTAAAVIARMDAYDSYAACGQLNAFVDALSNWYVRRSRDRFWSEDRQAAEKLDAYWTLYECLVTTAKLLAPFIPFVSEALWRNLAGVFGTRASQSVHLCDYPGPAAERIDQPLSERMALVREITSLGRAARMEAKLKVRQPLSKVEVVLADSTHHDWLQTHRDLIAEELNVKQVEFAAGTVPYIRYQVVPDFKRLGPRVGKLMPGVKKALAEADGAALMRTLEQHGRFSLTVDGSTVELDREDVQVRLQAEAGWTAAQGTACVVVLATELTPELVREGLARELLRVVQDRRKELGLEFTDRIRVHYETGDEELLAAIEENREHIMGETLCVRLRGGIPKDVEPITAKLGDAVIRLHVEVDRK